MLGPELRKYILYVVYRFWLVILVAALLGGAAYFFIDRQDPSYRAEARLFIGNALDPDPDRTEVQTALLLVPTYAEFARNRQVLEATIEALDLDMSVSSLRRMVSTRVITDTPLLAIRATTTDPERSAAIANEVARNIIDISPSNLTDEELERLDTLRVRLDELEEQIAVTSDEAATVQQQLNQAQEDGADEETIAELTTRYDALVDRLNNSRSINADISAIYTSLASRVGRLEIVEEATPPGSSSGFSPLLIGLVAAVGGAGATVAGLLLFLEYFDPRVRTEFEVVRRLEMPVLGKTRRSGKIRSNHKEHLTDGTMGTQTYAENYRRIQTNLLFASEKPGNHHIYMVASPKNNDGRTFTTANLAVVLASSGQDVLLIDADLRESRLHELFSADNSKGLTALLSTDCEDADCLKDLLQNTIQETRTPLLHLIPSGTDGEPVSPRVLGFEQFQTMIDTLIEHFDYDVILIDTPASRDFADSYMMAASSKAEVILVVAHARTMAPDIAFMRDQFRHVGATVMGVIMNKV